MKQNDVLFIPIAKVDAARREVWGYAAEERPDKAGEVMDYDTSRPLFMAWSDGMAKATDGKSLGNVRAMHSNIAAGRLVHFEPQDDVKKFYVGAHIVDDAEWAKVEAGVYTGFSVGGSYAKRWTDPANNRLKRYTAAPSEISLVDSPCMYGATFELVKADGLADAVAFVGEGGDDVLAKLAQDLAALVDAAAGDGTDPDALAKAGARHSASDTAAIQSIHDSACKLGGQCATMDKADDPAAQPDGLAKDGPEPWIMAMRAGHAITDVASALAMLSSLANSLMEIDADAAAVIAAAGQMVAGTVEDLTGQLASATQAQVAQADAAATMKAAADAAVAAMLDKMAGDDSPLTKFMSGPDPAHDEALAKLAPMASAVDAIAAQLGALNDLTATIEKRVSASGPVVREIQAQPTQAGMDEAAILRKMAGDTTDPNVRQALQARAGEIDIRRIHQQGGTRIS